MAKKIDINNQAVAVGTEDDAFTLQTLSERIVQVDDSLRAKAEHAVNCLLTARNWFVGYYIVEYEQHGSDRARYGEQLLKVLAKHINRKGMTDRRLREYRQFYRTYPYIGQEIVSYLNPQVENILQPAIAKLPDSQTSKLRSLTAKSSSATEIWRSATAKFTPVQLEPWQTSPDRLLHRLSATHLILLSEITEPLKRAFYEQETMRGSWTVKELDRQISSLYYERSGLSKDKQALARHIQNQSESLEPQHILHNPMTLEFLGLQEQDVYTETKLETAILDHLQRFLMELGQGFCFEHRQRRVLIDHDYFKADLIFYHRILHCHVIIDLKIDRYRHEYASQLNTYKNYYRHEIMQPGDNPPIGLLLCTDYSDTLVRYSTEGLEDIYVSRYLLQLPSEESIRQYLLDNIQSMDENAENSEFENLSPV